MPTYLQLDITTDAATLYADGVDAIQSQAPGWEPSPIESWLLMAVARMSVEVAILAGSVPTDIFRYFGETVLRLPAEDATTASGTVTVTAASNPAGRTLAAGAQFDIDGVAFVSTTDLVLATGVLSGTVPVAAVDAGSAASGLTGAVELVSPVTVWVAGTALVGLTTGGADGETGDEYVDRIADELPTLSPKAILAPDYEVLARRDVAVERALAIDNYIPAGPGGTPAAQTNVEGAVTVAVHDATGADPGAPARTRVADSLGGKRVLNIDVYVIPPTYTRVEVQFTAHCYDTYDPAAVEAAAEQAIRDFLSPGQWGRPRQGASAVDWEDEPTLRRNDLFGVLYDVDGIRHVDTLTLALFGGTQATSDVTLAGPAALPAANSVANGTVTI